MRNIQFRVTNCLGRSPLAGSSDDPAMIYCTGWTTAPSKGVMLTHAYVAMKVLVHRAVVGYPDESKFLHLAPKYILPMSVTCRNDDWVKPRATVSFELHAAIPTIAPKGAAGLLIVTPGLPPAAAGIPMLPTSSR